MESMKTCSKNLLLGALLAACCVQSFAQFGGAMGGAMGGAGRRSQRGEMSSHSNPSDMARTPVVRSNQVADKLFDLRMRLLISPEQSPAWEDFYAQARAWSPEAFKGRTATASTEQSALQSLQWRLGEAQNRYALMEALNDSVKRLYAVLSPEQQRIADQYLMTAIP
jgi:hypothetical protein